MQVVGSSRASVSDEKASTNDGFSVVAPQTP
jgi:hypothetical protein